MTNEEYLNEILKSQTLANDGNELKLLRQRRTDVEKLLRDKYGSSPSIRYGGSKAKGTMIKDSYDLDVICYFENDDGIAGDTLQEIYDDVADTFEDTYYLERKPSAIRLKCKDSDEIEDYHIDVVPGRYVDDEREDVFLYRHSGEKGRQKTNLNVHIDHVKDSGAIPAIRLGKLWRVRNNMAVRNFILELITIKLLKDKKNKSLTDQLIKLWTELRDNIDDVTIEDPANPTGNDLSELFNTVIKFELSEAARAALELVDDDNWTAIFGEVPENKAKSASAGHSNGTSSNPRIFVPRPAFGGE